MDTIRIDIYKTAQIEAQTLIACGWSPDEVSVDAIYKRLVEDLTNGQSQGIPTEKEFREHEKHCRTKDLEPYRS